MFYKPKWHISKEKIKVDEERDPWKKKKKKFELATSVWWQINSNDLTVKHGTFKYDKRKKAFTLLLKLFSQQ
jgi:hypothetical protein